MTPKERAVMQQALDTSLRVEQDSEECEGEDGMVMVVPLDAYNDMMASINAMREALAEQAEQEPVAWIKLNEDGVYIEDVTGFPVYAAPVQQVDLTDDEIERALDAAKVPELPDGYKSVDLEIARAVIAADREKNK